ncbi:hypothetical protein DYB37_004849 [Aphanomyces astaci]|uniref:Pentacotripeptide-repeat region of PRORP domain-containing protein n=2 Tax=Aphanomyces astaci TaxID=112090 RepID=A0A3R6YMN7_APHAT|nr:hypothetical protein DYB35_003796 [Aphanomyces astaci]RHZ19181.1 hypothetical protein DYB37_004849 [Aphanomyces astaci]
MRDLCNRGEFAAVVQEVAKWYQPLASALQAGGHHRIKRQSKATTAPPPLSSSQVLYNAEMTAQVESEAMALLVQHRATDAALLLFDNLHEMATASSLVMPKRQTMSFILGVLTFNRQFSRVLRAYDLSTSLSIFPTESMNANYLSALVRTTQFDVAASAWRTMCARKYPRGLYAYREAMHIFSTLNDAKEIMAILDDVDIHGIKLREVDYARAMLGLASAIRADVDQSYASDCADLILDLYEKMQTFENIPPTSPELFGSVMEAAVYIHDFDMAVTVYEDFGRLPYRAKSVDYISGPFVEALISSGRSNKAMDMLQKAHAQKHHLKASTIAGRMTFYYASRDLDADLMAVLAACPPSLRLIFRSDKEAMTVLHKVTRTTTMHEVDLWTFLAGRKELLSLDTHLWWWKALNMAEGAKKWRLLRLMLTDPLCPPHVVKPQQWRSMLKNCARRVGPDDVEGHAFVVYVAKRLGTRNELTPAQLEALVTAYSLTNDHASAIATFRQLHKLNLSSKQPPTQATVTAYESARKSFVHLGYDAEANQIDAILTLQHHVVPKT